MHRPIIAASKETQVKIDFNRRQRRIRECMLIIRRHVAKQTRR